MENQINFLSVLPPQIISRIASRLPVKSLVNCMLVCKLWRNLLPNPLSAKSDDVQFLFYDHELTNPASKFGIIDDDPHERLIDGKSQIFEMKPFHLPPTIRYVQPEKLFIDRSRVSSCNGLVCFSVNNSDVYLCNPILGEFVSVPKPSIDSFYCDMYDLGFCHSSNQYKLTRFVCTKFDDKSAELEILTIGSQAGWRRHAGVVPSQIWEKSYSAICAKGALHWFLLLEEKSKRYILTFDLAEEEFGSVPLPPLDDDKEIYNLGYMDHYLVATAGHSIPLGFEIWARKELVWTKNWVVDATESLSQRTLSPSILKYLIPRKSSVDGRIFMTYLDEQLYCYDPKDRLVTDFVFSIQKDDEGKNPSGLRPWRGLLAYTATLVSPQKLMPPTPSKKQDREETLKKRDRKKRRELEKTKTTKKLMRGKSNDKRDRKGTREIGDRKKRQKTEKKETTEKLMQDESSKKRDRKGGLKKGDKKKRLKTEKKETTKALLQDESSKKRDRKRTQENGDRKKRLKTEKKESTEKLVQDESSKTRNRKARQKKRDRKKRLNTEKKETTEALCQMED